MMSSVLVARQPVISFLSKGTLNLGQRYLTGFAQTFRLRRISYSGHACLFPLNVRDRIVTDRTVRDRTFKLGCHHVHVWSTETQEQLQWKKKPPKYYMKQKMLNRRVDGFVNLRVGEFDKEMHETLKLWEKENPVPTQSDWELLSHKYSPDGGESILLMYDAKVMNILFKKDLPEMALSFLEYVRKYKKPSTRVITLFLAVCGREYPELVFKEYEELRKNHVSIDFGNYMYLIVGFSKTKKWKMCLQFLEEVKDFKRDGENLWVLDYVLNAAVEHNDLETFNYLLKTYVQVHATSSNHSILLPQRYTNSIFDMWRDGRISGESLLKYLSIAKGYLSEDQAEQLEQSLCSKEEGTYNSYRTRIYRGSCSECGEQLKGMPFTSSQVEVLAKEIHKYVTSRKHLHIYTTEKEYQHFTNFLAGKQEYDLVVDIANYIYPFFPKIKMTKAGYEMKVIHKYHSELFYKPKETVLEMLAPMGNVDIRGGIDIYGKNMIVLTSSERADILRARLRIMESNKSIFQMLDRVMKPFERILFVTNNGVIVKLVKDNYDFGVRYHMYMPAQKSDDDFFALAAALHSGPDCYLLSGDNYKNLKKEFGETLIPLFEQWQRRRQIFIQNMQDVVKMPQDYDFCVQEDKEGWHVPYSTMRDDKKKVCYFSMPTTLLCLRRK